MKKLLLLLISLPMFSIGQNNPLDTTKTKKISFDFQRAIGIGFVQDKNSPYACLKIGISNDNFKLHIVNSGNLFFSTEIDDSRKVFRDKNIGIEWIATSSYWSGRDRDKDKWGGIGFSYCWDNESELHEKNPIRLYGIYYFDLIAVTTEVIYSDIIYPSLTVRFEF